MAHQRWLFLVGNAPNLDSHLPSGAALAHHRAKMSSGKKGKESKAREQAGFQGPIPSQGCVPHISLLAGQLGTVTRDQQPRRRAQPSIQAARRGRGVRKSTLLVPQAGGEEQTEANSGALPGHTSTDKGTDPHRRCSLPRAPGQLEDRPFHTTSSCSSMCTSWRWSSEDEPRSRREHGNIELGACTGWKAKCPGRAPLPVATSPAPALTCWGRHPRPRAVFNCHYKLNCVMQQLVKREYNSRILPSSFYFSLPPPLAPGAWGCSLPSCPSYF